MVPVPRDFQPHSPPPLLPSISLPFHIEYKVEQLMTRDWYIGRLLDRTAASLHPLPVRLASVGCFVAGIYVYNSVSVYMSPLLRFFVSFSNVGEVVDAILRSLFLSCFLHWNIHYMVLVSTELGTSDIGMPHGVVRSAQRTRR